MFLCPAHSFDGTHCRFGQQLEYGNLMLIDRTFCRLNVHLMLIWFGEISCDAITPLSQIKAKRYIMASKFLFFFFE